MCQFESYSADVCACFARICADLCYLRGTISKLGHYQKSGCFGANFYD